MVTSSSEDLVKLVDIARMSHKYSFKTLETWTLDVIQDYVTRKPSPILTAIPAPSTYTFSSDVLSSTPGLQGSSSTPQSTEQLTRLIRLAQLCSHELLLGTMIGLLKQLMSSSLQYAYLAMTLADELDLRSLRGVAYRAVMEKGAIVKQTKIDLISKSAPQPGEGISSSNSKTAHSKPSAAAPGSRTASSLR